MKKAFVALLMFALLASIAFAQQSGTKDEAVALVKKAVAHYKSVGKEKAFADFNDKNGPFVDRDLYIVVYDMNGNCLAHGANAKQIGKNLMELRDPDGNYFVKERVELGKTKDSFWQNYKFINPVSKQIENKSMYMEKIDGLLFGCGAYNK
ncbi:cache domain-containing protein [Fundidesulfovibrio terrae]|uniref:cache domain-containing protein n=1 Tax=Fundidesulfovibrio terrae TaxID=2922866 RepID=UPI001FAEE348|nr:cache domain-containing protein [Fundidesulfovibrio terrae]